jgi:ribosomal protein L19E
MKRKPRGDYALGYCRPPEDKRFRKGKSGNPRGRRKGSKNARLLKKQFDSYLMKALNSPITINTHSGQREVASFEALALRFVHGAFKDTKQCKDLLEYLRELEVETPPDPLPFHEVRRIIVDPKNITEDEIDGATEDKKKKDDG